MTTFFVHRDLRMTSALHVGEEYNRQKFAAGSNCQFTNVCLEDVLAEAKKTCFVRVCFSDFLSQTRSVRERERVLDWEELYCHV